MSKRKLFSSKDELEKILLTRSVAEAAKDLGVGETTLRRYLKKLGVITERKSGPIRKVIVDKDELEALYQDYSAKDIAKHYGVGETVVWKRIKEFGIQLDGLPGGHRCKTGIVFSDEHRSNLSKALKGKFGGENNPNWKGGNRESVCRVCGELFEQSNGGKAKFCSHKCRGIHGKYTQIGEDNKNWRGGKDQQRKNTIQAKQWRKQALERSGYVCEECGIDGTTSCACCNQTPDLHVHHIKPWREYPEHRYDLNNAEVLCTSCHRAVHRGNIA
jgi:5-methylcytosine-specific restriction endonuclease McrA